MRMEGIDMIEMKSNSLMDVPKIVVIGVGGGGNNALDRMISSCNTRVEYIAINTDIQVLNACMAENKIQIGKKLTNGYGAGANPQIGETAAMENEEEIKAAIEGADMCIITCGMGGGTGTGAAPVIAKYCKEEGILTVGVVTTPFTFENTPRIVVAKNGVENLKANVDTLLVIPNDKLIGLSEKPLLLEDAFKMADTILKDTIEGITNIVCNLGIINLDFNDLKTTLVDKGVGHLGIGRVNKDASILDAVKQAVKSPLLETSIEGAENILINTSGKIDVVSLNEAICYVRDIAGSKVNIIWGTVTQADMDEEKIIVTLIATGMEKEKKIHAVVPPIKEVEQENTKIVTQNVKIVPKRELDIAIPAFLQEAGMKRKFSYENKTIGNVNKV